VRLRVILDGHDRWDEVFFSKHGGYHLVRRHHGGAREHKFIAASEKSRLKITLIPQPKVFDQDVD